MAETKKLDDELENPPPELLEKLEVARSFELLKMMRELHLFRREPRAAGNATKKGKGHGDDKQK